MQSPILRLHLLLLGNHFIRCHFITALAPSFYPFIEDTGVLVVYCKTPQPEKKIFVCKLLHRDFEVRVNSFCRVRLLVPALAKQGRQLQSPTFADLYSSLSGLTNHNVACFSSLSLAVNARTFLVCIWASLRVTVLRTRKKWLSYVLTSLSLVRSLSRGTSLHVPSVPVDLHEPLIH